jgi:hypothetical protein
MQRYDGVLTQLADKWRSLPIPLVAHASMQSMCSFVRRVIMTKDEAKAVTFFETTKAVFSRALMFHVTPLYRIRLAHHPAGQGPRAPNLICVLKINASPHAAPTFSRSYRKRTGRVVFSSNSSTPTNVLNHCTD